MHIFMNSIREREDSNLRFCMDQFLSGGWYWKGSDGMAAEAEAEAEETFLRALRDAEYGNWSPYICKQ